MIGAMESFDKAVLHWFAWLINSKHVVVVDSGYRLGSRTTHGPAD